MNELIIGDLHLGSSWDGISRDDDIINFLGTLVKKYEKVTDIKRIVWLGDIFDSPHVSHGIISEFIQILNSLPNLEHEIIKGNHDGEIESIKGTPLEEINLITKSSVRVTYQPHLEGKDFFIPYTTKENFDAFTKVDIPKDTIAYCHVNIPEAIPGFESELARGAVVFLPKEISDKCAKVYAGHIHKPQRLGNIIIVGSVLKTTISEAAEVKSYVEIKDDETTFHTITNRPLKNYDINYSTPEGQKIYEELKNGTIDTKDQLISIRMYCPHDKVHELNLSELEDKINKSAKHLRFNFSVLKEKEFRIKELDAGMSDLDIAKTFVEKQEVRNKNQIIEDIALVMDEVSKCT